jgi:ribosomal protein S18 acetylase RimI-like enzyme
MSASRPEQATTFRRLATNEHEDLLRHFLRLGTEDRRLRFGGYVGEERLRAYCRRLDQHPGSLVLGCFIAGELRGVGELKPIEDIWPRAAELAVSVEEAFRGRGLGTELCRRLIVRARNRFIARLYMLCLPDNRPVQGMTRKLGGALSFYQSEIEARLEPPWPDPASASEEWLDEIDVLLGPGSLSWAGFRPPWWGAPASFHLRTSGETR